MSVPPAAAPPPPSEPGESGGAWASWEPRLRALSDGIGEATRRALEEASASGEDLGVPVCQGVGDVTYALDVPSEEWIAGWLEAISAEGPISLLTEDTGWRHRGPAGELEGFDHGGPRIAIDPVDGTRNLMAGLRSAWTVVSFAPPGAGQPDMDALTGGLVVEIPPPGAPRRRLLSAGRGQGCRIEEHALEGVVAGTVRASHRLSVDADDRADHGYFPFFRYEPRHRPELARLEAAFFARLAEHEGAEVARCYDDQYISNAGQLFLLATGTYRSIVDARALVAARAGVAGITSKPYDLAGAILCAREAGAVVTAADGAELAFPIDAATPVHFAGWANPATRARLEPHWLAALAQT